MRLMISPSRIGATPAKSESFCCPLCRRYSEPRPVRIRHSIHLALTIFSLGLWGVSWVALIVSRWRWPFECKRCGLRITAEVAQKAEEKPATQPNLDIAQPTLDPACASAS